MLTTIARCHHCAKTTRCETATATTIGKFATGHGRRDGGGRQSAQYPRRKLSAVRKVTRNRLARWRSLATSLSQVRVDPGAGAVPAGRSDQVGGSPADRADQMLDGSAAAAMIAAMAPRQGRDCHCPALLRRADPRADDIEISHQPYTQYNANELLGRALVDVRRSGPGERSVLSRTLLRCKVIQGPWERPLAFPITSMSRTGWKSQTSTPTSNWRGSGFSRPWLWPCRLTEPLPMFRQVRNGSEEYQTRSSMVISASLDACPGSAAGDRRIVIVADEIRCSDLQVPAAEKPHVLAIGERRNRPGAKPHPALRSPNSSDQSSADPSRRLTQRAGDKSCGHQHGQSGGHW